jgi:SOS-response transcriptional repressor LexA
MSSDLLKRRISGHGTVTENGRTLKELRELAGLSVRKMADAIGVKPSTYQYREKPDDDKLLPMEWADKIAPVLKEHGVDPADVYALAGVDAVGPKQDRVEVTGWVKAGAFEQSNEIPHDDRPAPVIWPFHEKMPKGVQALEVRGDSMDMMFPAGSTIFAQDPFSLEEEGKAVLNGDIVVVRRKNEAGDFEYTLKELGQKADGSFELIPRSHNIMHQPFPYEPVGEWHTGHFPDDGSADSLCIVGVVVGAVANYKFRD